MGPSPTPSLPKAVGSPARAWKLFQVRVSPEVWAWTHRLAALTRSYPGEVIERAILRFAASECGVWPEEDLPRSGRYRGRYILVYEPFTKRVVGRRRRRQTAAPAIDSAVPKCAKAGHESRAGAGAAAQAPTLRFEGRGRIHG